MELDYQLHRLGWKGFQQLCGTILRQSMGQTYQVFSDVNDAGRDGAFHGTWTTKSGEIFRGTFTTQCKHTARRDEPLRLSSLAKELEKAKALGRRGLAENYLLFTNLKASGVAVEEIERAFSALPGIQKAKVFPLNWIESQILENTEVRMNVPRIYGLGDLTQILDERAYAQGQAILNDLGDDFSRFVVTEAYRKSVNAVTEKGFVFLLGEPCCGKSTIAAALALAAADKWKCHLVRITDPRDFSTHWNAKSSDQFFWVDDAFGSTQYERELALAWNRVFPIMKTAIKGGAKVVFTSRDYVYKAATDDIKDFTLPELRDSQVVIHVEELTVGEKEQILYNHTKLGSQPKHVKLKLKRHLADIALHPRFLPETARRINHPFFTQDLIFSKSGLLDFVVKMKEFLLDTLRTIGIANSAAVALVFMKRGKLGTDLVLSNKDENTLGLLGATVSEVRKALNRLDTTLFIKTIDDDKEYWGFKHPSIRDAYGTLISNDPALSDIYLENTSVRSLVREITCGGPDIEGVKLKVPPGKFHFVLTRLRSLDLSDEADVDVLLSFLRNRCGKAFLTDFLAANPAFVESLEYGAWMIYSDEVRLVAKLHQYGLLSESDRLRLASAIETLTFEYADASCFREPEILAVLNASEQLALRRKVKIRIFGSLRNYITNAKARCLRDKENVWSAFTQVDANIKSFAEEFRDLSFQNRIKKANHRVSRIKISLYSKESRKKESLIGNKEQTETSARSIFDDVDE